MRNIKTISPRKNLFLGFFSCLFIYSASLGQIVITAPDNICLGTPVTFNLYQNGALNTQPARWKITTPNNTNYSYTITESTYSTLTVVFTQAGDGCVGDYIRPTPCCRPPYFNVSISTTSSPSVLLAGKSFISIGCPFPITGPNALAIGSEAIFNIPRTEVQRATVCAQWYSVWVVSENLQFVEPFELFNSTKIKVKRVDVGTAYLSFYLGDGVMYTKTIY